MKPLKLVFLSIYTILVIFGAVLLFGLFWIAATAWGRLVALGGLAVLFLPAALLLRSARPRLGSPVSLVLGMLVITIAAGVLISTPSGDPGPGSPVHQRFTGPRQFPRYTFTNIVPEIEQVNLGFWVMPLLDRFLIYPQARRVSVFTLDLYREMESDPDFHALGSAMGWTYAEQLRQPYDVGHYYLYIPKKRPAGALPAIVFLHGSYGNFKAYTWAWSHLAEELGYVVISPSFGFGNWGNPGGVESVLRALEDARTVVELDEKRIYLAGLSNGGLGVSRLAAAGPDRFRGLIFISPVMATEIIDQTVFQQQWAGRPVLVLTGEADERIPVEYVNERVERLVKAGVPVEYVTYPGEDHFLFFSGSPVISGKLTKP